MEKRGSSRELVCCNLWIGNMNKNQVSTKSIGFNEKIVIEILSYIFLSYIFSKGI